MLSGTGCKIFLDYGLFSILNLMHNGKYFHSFYSAIISPSAWVTYAHPKPA